LAGSSPLVMFGDRDRTGQLTQETDPGLVVTGKGESKTKGHLRQRGHQRPRGDGEGNGKDGDNNNLEG